MRMFAGFFLNVEAVDIESFRKFICDMHEVLLKGPEGKTPYMPELSAELYGARYAEEMGESIVHRARALQWSQELSERLLKILKNIKGEYLNNDRRVTLGLLVGIAQFYFYGLRRYPFLGGNNSLLMNIVNDLLLLCLGKRYFIGNIDSVHSYAWDDKNRPELLYAYFLQRVKIANSDNDKVNWTPEKLARFNITQADFDDIIKYLSRQSQRDDLSSSPTDFGAAKIDDGFFAAAENPGGIDFRRKNFGLSSSPAASAVGTASPVSEITGLTFTIISLTDIPPKELALLIN